MVEETGEKKKRGAPEGNQYARKHGFYSHVLSESEQADYELATRVEGIDEEIALLRVKIKHGCKLTLKTSVLSCSRSTHFRN